MTKSTEMFFALLRLSIDEGSFDSSPVFSNAEKSDWEQLFELSARQGSILLTYGGLHRLSAETQPPRKLKLRWCANVVKGSERYDRYKRAIAKLSLLLSEKDIDLLIIKGVTISELYPVPYYREGGDVDVYLFGKAQQANDLISSKNIEVKLCIAKHSAFIFDGVVIENHYTFFDTNLSFQRESNLYQRMENMLTGMFSKDSCPMINSLNAHKLPPQAAALYLIGHTFRHFCSIDINIRQLCDWTVFFSKCAENIDRYLLESQIRTLGLKDFVTGVNAFCSDYLGFKPAFMIPSKKDAETERLILKMAMQYRVAPIIHIPAVGVLRHIAFRNRIYNRYLGPINLSEFLLPEVKSYFSYLLKRKRRSKSSK